VERNRDLGPKHLGVLQEARDMLDEIIAVQTTYNEKMAKAEAEALDG
jgi:hypothetical protein